MLKTQVQTSQPMQYESVVKQTALSKIETMRDWFEKLSKPKNQKQKCLQKIECEVKVIPPQTYKASDIRIKLIQPKTQVRKLQ